MKELVGMLCALVVVLLILCGSVCAVEPAQVSADIDAAEIAQSILEGYQSELDDATQEEIDDRDFNVAEAVHLPGPLFVQVNSLNNQAWFKLYLQTGSVSQRGATYHSDRATAYLGDVDSWVSLAGDFREEALIYEEFGQWELAEEAWEDAESAIDTASAQMTNCQTFQDRQATKNGDADLINGDALEIIYSHQGS